MSALKIRCERPEDTDPIRRVNELAFARPNEADLVDNLRLARAATLSQVAELEGTIAGHILFSPVTVQSPAGDFSALGLAPLAVLPELQNRGIGSRLVHASLVDLRAADHGIVVVLGHPGYYLRFGFLTASAVGIRWEKVVPEEAFMVLELKPGALCGRSGVVRYRPEFDLV